MEKEFDLEPLFELLEQEVDLDSLLEHLHNIYYRFTEHTLKSSNLDGEPIYDDVIVARYWIERLIRLFEEMKVKVKDKDKE